LHHTAGPADGNPPTFTLSEQSGSRGIGRGGGSIGGGPPTGSGDNDPIGHWGGGSGDPPPPDDEYSDDDDDSTTCSSVILWVNNDDDDFDGIFDLEEITAPGGTPGEDQSVDDENDFYAFTIGPPSSPPAALADPHWWISYSGRLALWFRPAGGDYFGIPVAQRVRRMRNGVEWVRFPSGHDVSGEIPSRTLAVEAIEHSGAPKDINITVHYAGTVSGDPWDKETSRCATAYGIEVEGAVPGDEPRFLRIGHWGDDGTGNTLTGYNTSNALYNGNVNGTFIEGGTFAGTTVTRAGDPDRFRVHVFYPRADDDPSNPDQFSLWLSTRDAYNSGGGAEIDDETDLISSETGASTGDFDTEDQLLVSLDLPPLDHPDDDHRVRSDRAGANPLDDAAYDRTHKVPVDGAVRVRFEYGTATATRSRTLTRPVSDRRRPSGAYPVEGYKILRLRIHRHYEPFQDVGYGIGLIGAGDGVFSFQDTNSNGKHDIGEPSEPYRDLSNMNWSTSTPPGWLRGNEGPAGSWGPVATAAQVDAQVERANLAWAQAGIQVILESQVTESAPDELLTEHPDGWFCANAPFNHDQRTILAIPDATQNRAEIIFTGPILAGFSIASGYARVPANQGSTLPSPLGENTYIFVGPNVNVHWRTLAHEIGHGLTNRPDSTSPPYVFFPYADAPPPPDDSVERYRRITHATESQARTERPTGNLTATGNRLLRNP